MSDYDDPPLFLQKVLAIAPMVTGSVSVISSIIMIYMLKRSYTSLSTPYHRILFGLCVTDIVQSTTLALSTLPVPRNIPGIMYAIGNQITCNIQGYLHLFSATTETIYFCGLTGYFFLAIKIGLNDEVIQKYYEKIVHIVSISYGLICSTFVVFHSGFYTTGNMCWIAPRPFRCDQDPTMKCTSGSDYNKVQWATQGWLLISALTVSGASMFMILHMLQTQSNTPRISAGAPTTTITTSESDIPRQPTSSRSLFNNNNSKSNTRASFIELYEAERRRNKRLTKSERERREGMIQCALYIAAFLATYLFSVIYYEMYYKHRHPSFIMLIIGKVLRTSQGFFTFCIYLRQRIILVRKKNKSVSTCKICIIAIQSRGEPKSKKKRRRSSGAVLIPKRNSYSRINQSLSVQNMNDVKGMDIKDVSIDSLESSGDIVSSNVQDGEERKVDMDVEDQSMQDHHQQQQHDHHTSSLFASYPSSPNNQQRRITLEPLSDKSLDDQDDSFETMALNELSLQRSH